jgi:hypothetical protein
MQIFAREIQELRVALASKAMFLYSKVCIFGVYKIIH